MASLIRLMMMVVRKNAIRPRTRIIKALSVLSGVQFPLLSRLKYQGFIFTLPFLVQKNVTINSGQNHDDDSSHGSDCDENDAKCLSVFDEAEDGVQGNEDEDSDDDDDGDVE